MNKSRLLGAVCGFILAMIGTAVQATHISVTDAVFGDDSVTKDTDTGLEWLDLTISTNRSWDDLVGLDGSSEFIFGGDFEGWRYATLAEVQTLLANHGFPYINPNFNEITNQRTENVPFYISFVDLFGETCPIGVVNCTLNLTQTRGWIDGPTNSSVAELVYDHQNNDAGINFFNTSGGSYVSTGSFLARVAAVPIPPALWLFGSGLLGLIGIARRKCGK
jgi:hypothetical protein